MILILLLMQLKYEKVNCALILTSATIPVPSACIHVAIMKSAPIHMVRLHVTDARRVMKRTCSATAMTLTSVNLSAMTAAMACVKILKVVLFVTVHADTSRILYDVN